MKRAFEGSDVGGGDVKGGSGVSSVVKASIGGVTALSAYWKRRPQRE